MRALAVFRFRARFLWEDRSAVKGGDPVFQLGIVGKAWVYRELIGLGVPQRVHTGVLSSQNVQLQTVPHHEAF